VGGPSFSTSPERVQRGLSFERPQPDHQHSPLLRLVKLGREDVSDELAPHGRLLRDGCQVQREPKGPGPHLETVEAVGNIEQTGHVQVYARVELTG